MRVDADDGAGDGVAGGGVGASRRYEQGSFANVSLSGNPYQDDVGSGGGGRRQESFRDKIDNGELATAAPTPPHYAPDTMCACACVVCPCSRFRHQFASSWASRVQHHPRSRAAVRVCGQAVRERCPPPTRCDRRRANWQRGHGWRLRRNPAGGWLGQSVAACRGCETARRFWRSAGVCATTTPWRTVASSEHGAATSRWQGARVTARGGAGGCPVVVTTMLAVGLHTASLLQSLAPPLACH